MSVTGKESSDKNEEKEAHAYMYLFLFVGMSSKPGKS